MIYSTRLAFYNSLVIVFVVSMMILSSCEEAPLLDTSEIELSTSLDTLRFDTVFTEIGSITRFVKIYNHESQPVIVDDISLASNDQSFFRINVDGFIGPSVQDIRIEAEDSIYVFVETTIDPNLPLSASPFIIEDSIYITASESTYSINLEAFGQNANYIPNRQSAGDINALPCSGTIVWDDEKPYVIYGVLAIDQCDLVIAAGTKVYVHGGIAINDLGIFNDGLIVVTETGSITTQGTPDDPVYFRTDRLEPSFQDIPGQWAGIFIQANSRNNEFNNTIIQHSIAGLSIDSSASINLRNSELSFTSGAGLTASHAFVNAENCLFYENGTGGVSINYGGSYTFNYCTIGNYNNQGPALSMNNIRCTDPLCQEEIFVFPLSAEFNNCIITGNEMDEISLFDITDGEPGAFEYSLDHCAVTVQDLLQDDVFPDFFSNCESCLEIDRTDTIFFDIDNYDYHLDTLSIVIDQGFQIPQITRDLEGNPRENGAEDIGCYEFQK